MARMLQALKNLEARSALPGPRPAAQVSNPPAEATAAGELPASEELPPVRVRPQRRSDSTPAVQSPTVVIETVQMQLAAAFDSVFVADAVPPSIEPRPVQPLAEKSPHDEPLLTEPELLLAAPVSIAPPVAEVEPLAAPAAESPAAQSSRISQTSATPLERSVRRTLGDAVRVQPLLDLAERIRRDVEQAGGKTVLLVGVGPESSSHEIALYAAAALGQRTGQVLLIDADASRQTLSVGLERAQQHGLAELLPSQESPRFSCRPTALAGLSLLPSGRARHVDLSANGPRLEEVLRQLSGDFSLVILDGGRTVDLAASALARICDATYFVVQLGAVETSEAQNALRDFRAAGARVLGCIAT